MGTNEKEKHMMVLDALTDALGRSEDQSAEEIKEELPPIEELAETPSQQPAEKPDWDAINAEKDAKYDARDAKKTKDIHKQVALKIAGYNLTEVARVDFEKEPKRLNDLANVITGFAEED